MAFHSYEFIFLFVPATYVAFLVAHHLGGWPAAIKVVALASLFFYAQFSLQLVGMLMVSVVMNYAVGLGIVHLHGRRRQAGILLAAGIAGNLLALGYFKYTNFLIEIANQTTGADITPLDLLVPIGVSFFTFVQIGYLVETYNGQVEQPGFWRYLVFATFFPCVTAGPLVLQREMLDQMKDRTDPAFDPARLSAGLTMFGMGLFKKVILADSVAPFANAMFDGVSYGHSLDPLTAWIGATCYALQLYFDFSGYSDMALGLGAMFGFKLPLNFDSPFKATNISDFWRRWHMTMTRFFTTFIFSPLAMRGMRWALTSKAGRVSRFMASAAVPVFITFVVAGLWHGAGWNFLVYGMIHGVAIAVYLGWREMALIKLPAAVSWLLTMAVVVSGLVVFRAPDLTTAVQILGTMWTGGLLGDPAPSAKMVSFEMRQAIAMVVLLGAIVLLLPNTQQIMSRTWISVDPMPEDSRRMAGLLLWRSTPVSAAITASAFCLAISSIGASTGFLYYQF